MRGGPVWLLILSALSTPVPSWAAGPAGTRPASIKQGSAVLPGGRAVTPSGVQFPLGPGPTGLAASAAGDAVAALSRSGIVSCLSVAEENEGRWRFQRISSAPDVPQRPADSEWRSVSGGVAILNRESVFVSEGASGRISLMDVSTGRRRVIDLNERGGSGSYAGELALDSGGGFLYAADEGRSRIAVVEARSRKILSFAGLSGKPVAMSLAPGGDRLYVVAIEKEQLRLFLIDTSDPSQPKVREGAVLGNATAPDVWPTVVALQTVVYVTKPEADSILEVDPAATTVQAEISLRLPGFGDSTGIIPLGLAYDAGSGRLFVAERGINAVAVIDTRSREFLGHIPAGWAPTRVAVSGENLFVLNSMGMGQGPNGGSAAHEAEALGRSAVEGGSVSIVRFAQENLAADTGYVMEANGLAGQPRTRYWNDGIRHVVLIAKGDRTFDDVLGDIDSASNGAVMSDPALARLGRRGYVDGRGQRLSIKDINVTPNHHAIAAQWSFNDNFYAAGGSWEALAADLIKAGKKVLSMDAGGPGVVSDQDRASRFIEEAQRQYRDTGAEFPDFVLIMLPNDSMAGLNPSGGYPYGESYAADNDLALGRILEFLSGTKWWREMAVFVTQSGTAGGLDHIDRSRTLLLCAGPWAKRNYASHVNSSFAGLRRTILDILRAPVSSIWDQAAPGVEDCLAPKPDPAPFKALTVDSRLFEPKKP
jgi:DNA-binding beta-propeller fold protein YncE